MDLDRSKEFINGISLQPGPPPGGSLTRSYRGNCAKCLSCRGFCHLPKLRTNAGLTRAGLPKNPLDRTALRLNTNNQNEPDPYARLESSLPLVGACEPGAGCSLDPSHRGRRQAVAEAADDVGLPGEGRMRHPEKNIETVAACPRLLTKAEVLALLGVTYTTVFTWMREGRFPLSIELGPSGGRSTKIAWLADEVYA